MRDSGAILLVAVLVAALALPALPVAGAAIDCCCGDRSRCHCAHQGQVDSGSSCQLQAPVSTPMRHRTQAPSLRPGTLAGAPTLPLPPHLGSGLGTGTLSAPRTLIGPPDPPPPRVAP